SIGARATGADRGCLSRWLSRRAPGGCSRATGVPVERGGGRASRVLFRGRRDGPGPSRFIGALEVGPVALLRSRPRRTAPLYGACRRRLGVGTARRVSRAADGAAGSAAPPAGGRGRWVPGRLF